VGDADALPAGVTKAIHFEEPCHHAWQQTKMMMPWQKGPPRREGGPW